MFLKLIFDDMSGIRVVKNGMNSERVVSRSKKEHVSLTCRRWRHKLSICRQNKLFAS